jgi:hypothetical protein
MRRRVILAALIAVTLLAGAVVHVLLHSFNRATIQNNCSSDLHDIELVLRDATTGAEFVRRRIGCLHPGQSALLRHRHNDLRAALRFNLAGHTYVYAQHYIDLWTGEGWIFAIQPDGRVLTGYESTGAHDPMTPLSSPPTSVPTQPP